MHEIKYIRVTLATYITEQNQPCGESQLVLVTRFPQLHLETPHAHLILRKPMRPPGALRGKPVLTFENISCVTKVQL